MNIPLEEIEFTFVRSQGPGGQNVNSVSSKALLKWNVKNSKIWNDENLSIKDRFLLKYKNKITKSGFLVLYSQESRDQYKNKLKCIDKLHNMLKSVIPEPKVRKKKSTSLLSKQQRLKYKNKLSELKKQRKKNFYKEDND